VVSSAVPPVQYASRRDGLLIAYQVIGEPGLDLIFLLGWASNLATQWELPAFAQFLTRLGGFSRLILFDRPGTGLSDRGSTGQVFEDRLDDILCVMDAVGSERTALFGCHLGGRLALLFAATYPQRTRAVVTFGAHPTTLADDDYPWGMSPEALDRLVAGFRESMNEEGLLDFFHMLAPNGDEATASWFRTFARSAITSIEAVDEVSRLGPVDIRDALGSVHVPTLIMHRTDDRSADVNASRYMAKRTPGARFVELPGTGNLPFLGDADGVLDLTEEFLTGVPPVREPDRVLATVLFTDIVDSTRRAAELGDRRWKEVLASHDELARTRIDEHRGRYVHTTGDGLLATFDGPARAVRCARAIAEAVRPLGIRIRAGCHTGEVELAEGDVQGVAVHIGSRVAALAGPDEVWTSSTVKDLTVGSGLVFQDVGEHELKGVPDRWRLYRVAGG
jgi:pimeloyl-ACP methyl ester carboxylesterase